MTQAAGTLRIDFGYAGGIASECPGTGRRCRVTIRFSPILYDAPSAVRGSAGRRPPP